MDPQQGKLIKHAARAIACLIIGASVDVLKHRAFLGKG